MAALDVYMNGYRVGLFSKSPAGAHYFQYDAAWLALPGSRPISLSMPLRHQPYQGDEVYNFFDNLLPDNPQIRQRILARHHAESTQPFDLLAKIGQDSVGALQLLPEGSPAGNIRTIACKPLADEELGRVLTGYLADAPLASTTSSVKPNLMFVLDDSGSMYQDFLPDWAGPISSVSAERFFNAAFNGLAYNPGSQYKPPAMFTAAGRLVGIRLSHGILLRIL